MRKTAREKNAETSSKELTVIWAKRKKTFDHSAFLKK